MAHILIIDDEKSVLDLLRDVFEGAGHEVREARDGDEGLRLSREEPPDLVITDVIMPGRGGLEVIRELRREHPDSRIIAMAGMARVLPRAMEMGADYALGKPFRLGELLKAAEDLLGRTKV